LTKATVGVRTFLVAQLEQAVVLGSGLEDYDREELLDLVLGAALRDLAVLGSRCGLLSFRCLTANTSGFKFLEKSGWFE